MNKLKIVLQQAMMISFGILLGISAEAVYYRCVCDDITLKWYHPISIVLAGFLCSMPTLILLCDAEISRKKYRIRIAIHCVLVGAIVMGLGYFFNWYTNLTGFIFIVIEYFCIYAFVWACSLWIGVMDEKKINAAIKYIQDEE